MRKLQAIRATLRGHRRRAAVTAFVLVLCGMALAVSAAAADTAPVNTSLPTLTGTAQQARTMTVQSGSWSGTAPIVLTYQWRRCNTSGAACTDIPNATAQTYTLAAADVGMTLRISVTAANSVGTAKALSDPSAIVGASNAPINTAVPSISGTAQQGATLTAVNGGWSGATPISFTYKWQRCDTNGAGCITIGGATGQTYVPVAADVGHTLRVEVTATNSGGSAAMRSGSSGVIAAPGQAPANTGVPTLSGSTLEGSTLSLSQGTWQGSTPVSFTFGWQRCDASGNNCAAIAGSTAGNYKLVRADVGNRVRGVVTASNANGKTTAYTALSAVVGSLLEPVNTALPLITGAPAPGRTVSATTGTWSGATPFQFSYQWARGNAKGGYDPIPEAKAQTYTVTTADLGHPLYVQIKAQNKYGPAWATSKPTANVANTAPVANVVSVASVVVPDRLLIAKTSFTPNVLRSRSAFQVRILITNSQGQPVQGALVYELGLPYGWVRNAREQPTGADGWVTLTVVPTAKLPVGHRGALVMFVRARKPGGSLLSGVSTRRLVQVRIG